MRMVIAFLPVPPATRGFLRHLGGSLEDFSVSPSSGLSGALGPSGNSRWARRRCPACGLSGFHFLAHDAEVVLYIYALVTFTKKIILGPLWSCEVVRRRRVLVVVAGGGPSPVYDRAM